MINIESNNIYITFYNRFADFLKQKQIDMYIKKSIKNKFGTDYDVFLNDDISISNTDIDSKPNMVKIEDIIKKHLNNISSEANNNNEIKYEKKPTFKKVQLSEEEKRIRDLKEEQPEFVILGRDITEEQIISVSSVTDEMQLACINGQIFSSDVRETKSGKMLVTLNVTDKTDTISCKSFLNKDKYEAVKPVKWHMIGHLQTNKVKYIIDKVSMIHSVDSYKLAVEIDKRAKSHGITMDILLQVNSAQEESKFGITTDETEKLIHDILENCENIRIRGLMCIAPFAENPEEIKVYFEEVKKQYDQFGRIEHERLDFKYLSMGMSHDFTVAIEAGSNLVRVGSAIFGERNYNR